MDNEAIAAKPVLKTITEILLVAGIPFLYCYFLFYTFHYQITHTGVPTDAILDLADQHLAGMNEHDGIEKTVLFAMFLFIGPAGYWLYATTAYRKLLAGVGAVLWVIFLLEMHFVPNLFAWLFAGHSWLTMLGAILATLALTLFCKWLYDKNIFLGRLLIAEIIILGCFVPYWEISYYDYSYILAPALKVLQTGKISAAYFQYDMLPSVPAWFILKFGGSAEQYRTVIEAGMFVFFVLAFVVARRFFVNKSLAFYLLAMLLIVRLFMGLNEITFTPQITSIRLDGWLLLFAASYAWGLNNFKTGLTLLFLVVMLNTFGIIYFLCYIFLLGFLLLFQLYSNYTAGNTAFKQTVINWVQTCYPNVLFGLGGMLVYCFLSGSMVNESLTIFSKFQIGMLTVLQDSIYWYFGAVFAFCFALLLIFKNSFTERYWHSALLLLFLVVGCSLYFFGRSHENNVINISGPLLFMVFLCTDVLYQVLQNPETHTINFNHKLVAYMPVMFIFSLLFIANSSVIYNNVDAYKRFVKSGNWSYPQRPPICGVLPTVQSITNGSPKVYFMTYNGDDFYFYYYGHYEIPSKFVPIDGWMLKSEKIDFANKLLEEGYYIVAQPEDRIFAAILPNLHFKKQALQAGYIALSQ